MKKKQFFYISVIFFFIERVWNFINRQKEIIRISLRRRTQTGREQCFQKAFTVSRFSSWSGKTIITKRKRREKTSDAIAQRLEQEQKVNLLVVFLLSKEKEKKKKEKIVKISWHISIVEERTHSQKTMFK